MQSVYVTVYRKESSHSKDWDTKILLNIYFAYCICIISSAKCMKYEIDLNKAHKR